MRKKRRKILLVVSALVLLSVTTIVIVVNSRLKSIVEGKIEQVLNENNNFSYKVNFEKLKLNWLTQSIILKGVTIAPENLIKSGNKDVNASAFFFKMRSLRIRRINIVEAIRNKKIDIGEIVIMNPEISVLINKKNGEKKTGGTDKNRTTHFSLDSIALKKINGVSLGKIILENAEITIYRDIKLNSAPLLTMENLSIFLEGITVDKLSPQSVYYKIRVASYHISGNNHSINLPGNKYKLSFENIILDKDQGRITIDYFKLKPKENIYKLAAKQNPSKEVYDIKTDKITLNGVDIKDVISNGRFYLNSIDVAGADILIVKDKRMPENLDKRPLFPNQLLYRLDIPLKIDTVSIENTFLQYSERLKTSKRLMTVQFSKINSKIFNISTKPSRHPVVIDFKGKLMKKVACSINVSMPVNATGDFTFNGKVGKGSFVLFNKATQPIGLVFNGGYLNELVFQGKGNSKYAYGKLIMKYQDIKVKVIDNSNVKKEKGFLSWAANKILRTSNPVKGKLRENTMFFERIPNKGFPGFLWKTVFSGLKATLIPSFEKSNSKAVSNLFDTGKKRKGNKKKR